MPRLALQSIFRCCTKLSFGKLAAIPLEYEVSNFFKKDDYLNRRIQFNCSADLCTRQKYFAKLIARIDFSNYCGVSCLESFLTGRRAYKTLRLVESKVDFEITWVEAGIAQNTKPSVYAFRRMRLY